MNIYEKESSVIIDVTDDCNPVTQNSYGFSLSRDSSGIEPSPTTSLRIRDDDVQYFEEYAPGVTYEYCLKYHSFVSDYSFLESPEFCQNFVVPWVATLQGTVKTPLTSSGVQAGVPNVEVCAYLKSDLDLGNAPYQCTETNLDGSYKMFVSQLWTGDIKEIILIPSFEDHLFFTSSNVSPASSVVVVPYREIVLFLIYLSLSFKKYRINSFLLFSFSSFLNRFELILLILPPYLFQDMSEFWILLVVLGKFL